MLIAHLKIIDAHLKMIDNLIDMQITNKHFKVN